MHETIVQGLAHHVTTVHAAQFSFSMSSDYGWVLLVAVVLSFEILLIGFLFPGRARAEFFTEEFMKANFGQAHREALKKDIEKGGYPDMGSGLYSNKLSYAQWYKFNNAQRAHQNYLQFMPSTLIFLLVGGLYFPVLSAAVGLGLGVFRVIYALGYISSGPAGRLIGALGNDATLLALLVLSVISSVYWIQGNSNS